MSREIKFRVRNLNTGKVAGYETISDGMWFISDKGQDWEDGTYAPAEGVGFQREQYTGLDSVSGQPIYEGDIVRTKYQTAAIEYWENGFYLNDLTRTNWGDGDVLEVIGNIYENPELLAQQENQHGA